MFSSYDIELDVKELILFAPEFSALLLSSDWYKLDELVDVLSISLVVDVADVRKSALLLLPSLDKVLRSRPVYKQFNFKHNLLSINSNTTVHCNLVFQGPRNVKSFKKETDPELTGRLYIRMELHDF